ncbi:MAG: maleylacetoacetate isomerase, partial [Polyangiaceae bacterium]
ASVASLVLYSYWRSSSSYRVRFALAAKKLAYQMITVNLLAGEQGLDAHKSRSPTGHVPCLLIEGKLFVESVAIIELLEELYPEPALFPKSPWDRARVRTLVEIVNSGIQPLQNMKVMKRVGEGEPGRAFAKHFNEAGLAAFEQLLEIHSKEGIRGKYTYGDSLTAADIFLVPQFYSAKRFGVDTSKFPRITAAAEAAMATEAARAAHPDNQPDAVK